MADEEIEALRAHLLETRRSLAFQQREARMLADQLERATVTALRAEASLAEARRERSRDEGAQATKQSLAIAQELAELRARVERHELLLARLHGRMEALLTLAHGTDLESEVHDLFTILDIHAPTDTEPK